MEHREAFVNERLICKRLHSCCWKVGHRRRDTERRWGTAQTEGGAQKVGYKRWGTEGTKGGAQKVGHRRPGVQKVGHRRWGMGYRRKKHFNAANARMHTCAGWRYDIT